MKYIYLICSLAFIQTINIDKVQAQVFSEESQNAGINHLTVDDMRMAGGCAFFDFNNDSLEDIYLVGGLLIDHLYQNNGNGTFTDVTIAAGLFGTSNINTNGITTGDINNDGYRDLFISTRQDLTSSKNYPNLLYLNNGNGTFTDISTAAGIVDSAWTTSATFGDYNNDGWIDIYAGNYIENFTAYFDIPTGLFVFAQQAYPNFLYLNNGNSTFTEVAAFMNMADTGCTLANAFTDFDNDGDADLYVANDFGEDTKENALFENMYPSNVLNDIAISSNTNLQIFSMGVAIGDYNENGLLDYYITNLGRNVLLENQGNSTFNDVTTSAGVEDIYVVDTLFSTSWGTQFLDYDNDTYLDLFVSNGEIPAVAQIATHPYPPNKFYQNNNANGTFTDISIAAGIADTTRGRGSAVGDYDNDGDLDLIQAVVHPNSATSDHSLLYRNDIVSVNTWLKIKLQGVISNRDAFGAHIYVKANGRSFIREIGGGSSYQSQNSCIAHFGLGSYNQADSVIINWPSGITQVLTNVSAYQYLEIIEDTLLIGMNNPSNFEYEFSNYPNPFKDNTIFKYVLFSKSNVQLTIYDINGKLVKVLLDESLNHGEKHIVWNAQNENGNDVASGTYFSRLIINGKIEGEHKLILTN